MVRDASHTTVVRILALRNMGALRRPRGGLTMAMSLSTRQILARIVAISPPDLCGTYSITMGD
jgi:hypothetical protein